MRISSGLAEINFNSISRQEKIYVWPKYKEEPVDPVKRITRYTESNGYYSKPLDSEKEKILNSYFKDDNATYSANKKTQSNYFGTVRPGTLFDALV